MTTKRTRTPRVNIKSIAAAALTSIDSVLAQWLPGGKREGAEHKALNPTRTDAKPGSFSINTNTGRWADFATGDKGGDVISFVAYIEGCEQLEAAKKLAAFLGVSENAGKTGGTGETGRKAPRNKAPSTEKPSPSAGEKAGETGEEKPISPIPAQVLPLPAHSAHGKPVQTWPYRNADGDVMFYVARFEPKGKRKQILPATYWPSGWRWKGVDAPRSLYNLDLIAAELDAPILVTEGEKAADAAAILSPDAIVTTSPNGASGADKADWSVLEGRTVRVWPDNDEPGQKYATTVARLAYAAGAESVEVLDLEALAVEPGTDDPRTLPEHWDAADALTNGWKANTFKAAARWARVNKSKKSKRGATARPQKRAAQTDDDDSEFERFDCTDDGVYYSHREQVKAKDGSHKWRMTRPKLICSKLEVLARTRDETGREGWGMLLQWADPDGSSHVWAMPASMLAGDGNELRRMLLDGGLHIEPGRNAHQLLMRYLQSVRTDKRAISTSRTGWQADGRAFVLPDRTIGDVSEPVVLQTESAASNHYGTRGTLQEWRDTIGAWSVGNSRLAFAVSVGLAPTLLEIAGEGSGGFHFRDGSSSGKTTLLHAGASVWGGHKYMRTWRQTDNALEAVAEAHSDTLLVLDELAEIDGKIAGETVYMLANQRGKGRANREGGARSVKTWRLFMMSSGETGLGEHIAAAGKRLKAGQDTRLADIPGDAGKGLGVWETLHGHESGAAFSDAIKRATADTHGHGGPAFIEALIKQRADLPAFIAKMRAEFMSTALAGHTETTSGQVSRVASRFAVVAVAGELAAEFEIVPWPKGEATRAALICFAAWVEARGGVGDFEEADLIRQVQHFFELHGEARFSDLDREDDSHAPRTANRAGFYRRDSSTETTTFYVFPQVFRNEITATFDTKRAVEVLIRCGLMAPTNEGKQARNAGQRRESLPGTKSHRRCYVFRTTAVEVEA